MIQLEYKDGKPFKGDSHFRPLLKIIESYPFPIPSQARKTAKKGWYSFNICGFTDTKVLRSIDPNKRKYDTQVLLIAEGEGLHLQLMIDQNRSAVSQLVLGNERDFLTKSQIKELFIKLIECELFWEMGSCNWVGSFFFRDHFNEWERKTQTMLTGLDYFGKEELEKRGGFAAFESNPYVQTQRIHDGLLVQVGDSPDAFDTPEGEQLLVNAINALPPLKN
jgi:hypothetical protein